MDVLSGLRAVLLRPKDQQWYWGRGQVAAGVGGWGRALWPAGTHPGQGFLDVLSGSGNVTEDHAGAILL